MAQFDGFDRSLCEAPVNALVLVNRYPAVGLSASGGAVARGDFDRPPTRSTARKLRPWAVRPKRNTNKRHPERKIPIPSARQDDRPAEPGVGSRCNVHTHAARLFIPGLDRRLGDPTGAVLATLKHTDGGFCVEALSEVLVRFGKPGIFNTDQAACRSASGAVGRDAGLLLSPLLLSPCRATGR